MRPSCVRTMILCACATTVVAAFPRAAHAQTGPIIYACLTGAGDEDDRNGRGNRNNNGDDGSRLVRIVSATTPCKRNEIRVQWNVVGPPGPAGPTGATGAIGPIGPIGPLGPTGPQGIAGLLGAQGPTGPLGLQGLQGLAGTDGAPGPIGPLGPTGPQGIAGLLGPQGPTGPLGLQGLQGLAGTDGAPGPIGPKGDKGDIGERGATGPQGLQGVPGSDGAPGPTGLQGVQGAQGLQGLQGPTGAQGQIGPQGTTGATGAQGPLGAQGATGAVGAQGPVGAQGNTGATGAQGQVGAQGSTGATGTQGPTGAQGPVGATGSQGPAGTNGATGAQGPAGTNGATGATGAIGATGPQGPAGTLAAPFTVLGGVNVGINNTAPNESLDVGGNIQATGIVSWGTGLTRTETRDDAAQQGGRSGMYETQTPFNFYPNASSWQHLIEARHSNTTNNYALQIAGGFFDQDLWYRKTKNSGNTAWLQVIGAGPRDCTAPFNAAGATSTASLGGITRSNTICASHFFMQGANFNEAQNVCFALGGHISTYNELYRLAQTYGVAAVLFPGDWIGERAGDNNALVVNTGGINDFESVADKNGTRIFRCVQSSGYNP